MPIRTSDRPWAPFTISVSPGVWTSSAELGLRPVIARTPSPKSPDSIQRSPSRISSVGVIRNERKCSFDAASLRKVYPKSPPILNR